MDTKEQIRTYIAQNLLFSMDGFNYSDDSSFRHEGIVDSVGVLNLVLFVEETFGIQVEDREVTPDNFDSVSKLSDYIHRKMATPT